MLNNSTILTEDEIKSVNADQQTKRALEDINYFEKDFGDWFREHAQIVRSANKNRGTIQIQKDICSSGDIPNIFALFVAQARSEINITTGSLNIDYWTAETNQTLEKRMKEDSLFLVNIIAGAPIMLEDKSGENTFISWLQSLQLDIRNCSISF